MAADCCSSCEYQRTVGYPSTSWASCYVCHRTRNILPLSDDAEVSLALVGKWVHVEYSEQTVQLHDKCYFVVANRTLYRT